MDETFSNKLNFICERELGGSPENLRRLSGGASQESWQFNIGEQRYVLRRTPNGQDDEYGAAKLPLRHEARLLQTAAAQNIAAPRVAYICAPRDDIGPAYIMDFVGGDSGETIARKILRNAEFSKVRPQLAAQCGTILASIHKLDTSSIANLPRSDAAGELATYKKFLQSSPNQKAHPYPVFTLAIKWLEQNMLPPPAHPALVHGDFRNGNLMITPEQGVVAVLDWELAHIGDPMEDLGWLCVPSWRFGVHAQAVGGFGSREDLFAAYEAAGGKVDPDAVRFWEILGTLKWGIMCAVLMVNAFESGRDGSVERASIGRRSSETEIDLLHLLEEVA